MVELHLVERGRVLRRSSLDGDAIGDARARPNPVRRIAQLLAEAGFALEGIAVSGAGHTFVKGGVEISAKIWRDYCPWSMTQTNSPWSSALASTSGFGAGRR